MSYYRKYRPQKFIDLIGQDHISKTLTNALSNGSFSHAYLFSGPRGSGKTSSARLMAKALNCQGRELKKDSFEPCGKCISCTEIVTGSSLDMIEIDAASNRGIDEMRELRDKINFAPSVGKYKVYIIDECHMLTKDAFNALLKTLEEPPSHAVFILATTEIHKVPPTILSRTQSFEFKKASQEDILRLLGLVAKKEKLNIEPDALGLIGRLSFGAYRDALSMLDQVGSLQIDDTHKITLAEVQAVLGQTAEGIAWDFAGSLARSDRKKSMELVEKIYFEGKDLENFIAQVITIFRKVMLRKADLSLDYEASKEDLVKIQEMADLMTLAKIVLTIEKLSIITSQVKTSILGQLPLEMAVFELTQDSLVIDEIKSVSKPKPESDKKVAIAEMSELSAMSVLSAVKNESLVVEMKAPVLKSDPVIIKDPSPEPQTNTNFDKWPEVILEVKSQNNTLAALLGGAVIKNVTPDQIDLVARFKFHADQICNKKNLTIIEAAVCKVAGSAYKVDCTVDKDLEIKKPLETEEAILNDAKEIFEI